MIFVTLGTQDKGFSRLLEAVDREIENKNIKEKVIVQAGYTKYESKNMEILDLVSQEEFNKLMKKCSLVITHGGAGSILTAIKNDKKVIAAARLKKYKEHTNDHQKQIIKEFAKDGYILELRDFNKLGKLIEKSKTFKPHKFISNTDNMINLISNYIENDHHISWYNKYRSLSSFGYIGVMNSLINILIFSLLYSRTLFYLSIIFSYMITLIITLLFNLLCNVKIRKNIIKYTVVKIVSLVLDLCIMHILFEMIHLNSFVSKSISNIIIIILSFIIVKFLFRKEEV